MADRISRQLAKVLRQWWGHKGSLAISLIVTLAALTIYGATFLGERPTPIFDSVYRLELSSLDYRFQVRGKIPIDPRIVIVDIDQQSQEALGHWPFPRSHFADLLDNVREDGGRVVAFDITFSQADETSKPLTELSAQLAEQQKKGQTVNPALLERIASLQKHFDYDQQFADAITRFRRVVLGNYFLYTETDLKGVSTNSLKNYADSLAFFPFPQLRPVPNDRGAQGEAGRLKLIDKYQDLGLVPRGAEANSPVLNTAVASEVGGTGYFNVIIDADGIVRRIALATPYGIDKDPANWDMYASIDVQTIRLYLGLPNQQTILWYGRNGVASVEFGPKLKVRPDDVSRLMVNFHGPARTYPYISFADAAQKKFQPGAFKDKIVLVGASATGIGDLRVTPFGGLDFPGVEVHANLIDNILNRQFLKRGGNEALTDVAFILLFGLPLGIWLAVTQPRWMPLGLALLLPFAGIVYFAFLHGSWLNFIVPALFTLVPNVSLVALYRVLIEEQEKRKVRGRFQQYVPPEVIRRLLDDPERVKPRKSEITILFSDIRGFTSISESLDAQELADLLNGYLTEMTRIVFRYQGTLDKYIGDAVMGFWGAPYEEPDHATRACNAALSMLARLAEMQKDWQAQGQPVLDIGIGLNTGVASVGNMGSSMRLAYTAMGDAVNLASRMEGLNKEYGTRIIISESTQKELRSTHALVRELDLIRVKGKLQPVMIYEVLDAEALGNAGKELVELFARGQKAYKQRDWQAAGQAFEQVLDRWPDDGPSRIFLRRCEEYLAEEPEADWDGVYVMKHK
jgi:adenylate cyclase